MTDKLLEPLTVVCDCGSSRAKVALLRPGENSELTESAGLNPAIATDSERRAALGEMFGGIEDACRERVGRVFFYGAGCRGKQLLADMRSDIRQLFPHAEVEVQSDMLGAARGALGRERGVVCILGTGANSCYYDGEKIVANTPPMGWILGDECSAAYFGKRLVADYFKRLMPKELAEDFKNEYGIEYAEAIAMVYSPVNVPPNRALGRFAPFVTRHLSSGYIERLVTESLRLFLERNVAPYLPLLGASPLPICFIGSLANALRDPICRLLASHFQKGLSSSLPSAFSGRFLPPRFFSDPLLPLLAFHA